jgi:serine protease Do
VPVNVVEGAVQDFIDEGRIVYGWLGVTAINPATQGLSALASDLGVEDTGGVLIDNVHTESPATDAGIIPGDFVTAVNGTNIENFVEFAREVGGNRPGTDVDFSVIRFGEEQSVTVTLEEQPSQEELNNPANLWPGMNILPLTDQIRQQTGIPSGIEGVIAIRVIAESPVATAGVRRGDIIVNINGTETPDATSFYRELGNTQPGDRIEFGINRGGREIGIRLTR